MRKSLRSRSLRANERLTRSRRHPSALPALGAPNLCPRRCHSGRALRSSPTASDGDTRPTSGQRRAVARRRSAIQRVALGHRGLHRRRAPTNQRRLVTVDRTGTRHTVAAPPRDMWRRGCRRTDDSFSSRSRARSMTSGCHDLTQGTLTQVTFDAGATLPSGVRMASERPSARTRKALSTSFGLGSFFHARRSSVLERARTCSFRAPGHLTGAHWRLSSRGAQRSRCLAHGDTRRSRQTRVP